MTKTTNIRYWYFDVWFEILIFQFELPPCLFFENQKKIQGLTVLHLANLRCLLSLRTFVVWRYKIVEAMMNSKINQLINKGQKIIRQKFPVPCPLNLIETSDFNKTSMLCVWHACCNRRNQSMNNGRCHPPLFPPKTEDNPWQRPLFCFFTK